MRKIFLLLFGIIGTVMANGQELSADKLIDMLSLTAPKLESQLINKKYRPLELEVLGDTAVKTYENTPAVGFGKKRGADTVSRKLIRSALKETFTLTYQTTSKTEYRNIIEALKKKKFYCDYEKDSSFSPASYLYQHEDYTAEASTTWKEDQRWYSIIFYKKTLRVDRDLYYAEDLLQFTSHEYLVYYFGTKNVKKDVYYFGGNDVAKCSVLLINTNRQVIFIWKDALNRRKISNLLFGGEHKLKSQDSLPVKKDSVDITAENSWLLKSGIHSGMTLFDLREKNQKNIIFCGGDAPNPGLIFPESSGKVDFKNTDVILGCMNCSDEKYFKTKIMNADKAMKDGRVFFILTIVLYPAESGLFE